MTKKESRFPSADPQDAQFGRKARVKEEQLDDELSRGNVPPDEPARERPRAGGKAKVVEENAEPELGRE